MRLHLAHSGAELMGSTGSVSRFCTEQPSSLMVLAHLYVKLGSDVTYLEHGKDGAGAEDSCPCR